MLMNNVNEINWYKVLIKFDQKLMKKLEYNAVTYETSLASRAGPMSDLVVNPVALKDKILTLLVFCFVRGG